MQYNVLVVIVLCLLVFMLAIQFQLNDLSIKIEGNHQKSRWTATRKAKRKKVIQQYKTCNFRFFGNCEGPGGHLFGRPSNVYDPELSVSSSVANTGATGHDCPFFIYGRLSKKLMCSREFSTAISSLLKELIVPIHISVIVGIAFCHIL